MGINWNNRIIADARLTGVHGSRLMGGYCLRLGIEFDVLNWNESGAAPVVLMLPARVWLQGQSGLSLGLAHPETAQPFTVSQYAGKRPALFDLPLTQQAMEALERHRNGQGVSLGIKLQAEVRRGDEMQIAWDDLTGSFNISQWIAALDQAGYGRTLLFEVPIPSEPVGLGSSIELLETARRCLAHHQFALQERAILLLRVTRGLEREALIQLLGETFQDHPALRNDL